MDCCTDTHMITGEGEYECFSHSVDALCLMHSLPFPVVNDPLSYDCSICRETLPSQPELNAHLYSHFEIRSCKRCNKSILVIGDLEFEFHRPRNCTGLDETSSKSNVSCFSEYLDDIDCKQNSLQAKIGDKQISCSRSRFPRTLDHTLGIFKLKWGVNDLETKDNEMKTEAELENDMTANETDLKLEPLSPERNVSAGNVRRVEAPSLRADNESDPELETAPEPEEFVMATRKRNRPLPKTIPCPDCGELFRHERTVKSHRRKMHGYREEIKCHICSREFNHTGTLQQHIRTHSDSYRYICCYCGKGTRISILRLHSESTELSYPILSVDRVSHAKQHD